MIKPISAEDAVKLYKSTIKSDFDRMIECVNTWLETVFVQNRCEPAQRCTLPSRLSLDSKLVHKVQQTYNELGFKVKIKYTDSNPREPGFCQLVFSLQEESKLKVVDRSADCVACVNNLGNYHKCPCETKANTSNYTCSCCETHTLECAS